MHVHCGRLWLQDCAKLHYLTMTLRPVNSSVWNLGSEWSPSCCWGVQSWITPWELTILKVTGPIKPEHHVQHSWWKAKFHALHRLFHASPGETPMRGSCLSARFAPAFDGIATIWLPKSPIIREESEQKLNKSNWLECGISPTQGLNPPRGCSQSVSMQGRKATSPLQETNTADVV